MTIRLTRRALVAGAGGAVLAGHGPAIGRALSAARNDDAFWADIAAHYVVPRDVIQLENGNWGAMARPVLATYERMVERVNRDTSFYARRGAGKDLMTARARLAEALGVPADEIVFTRNATEALKALILGYNRLKPGDAVLYADLDYDSMQACFDSLRQRRGVDVVRIALPEPATRASLLNAYVAAIEADPRIRLILLTHVSHRTGLALPVRDIVAAARARGVDAIVDAAHSWGQLDFALPDLNCDFVGLNGHKWLGAPLGVGAIHIRKARLSAIDRDPASDPAGPDDVQARVHTGTSDFAALLTIPAALDFQAGIGRARRAARLRALRDRWVSQVRTLPGVQILTPEDPTLHGGITAFRLDGATSEGDNVAIARALLDRFGLFVVHRTGPARGACVRVTPALFNTMADMDALARAITILARERQG